MQGFISVAVFLIVIVTIISEKIHRAAAALAGATLLILLRVLTVKDAVRYIDANTIGVLVGMMIFVAIVKNSGMFEFVAIKAAKIAGGDPWKVMIYFVIVTAVLSSFLDNVTTVLLVGPMTITIASMLQLNPVPFLMMQILASNVGGTATLIGDPPNIMIGSATGLTFIDFLSNTGVAVVFIMIALIIMMRFMYKKNLVCSEEARMKVAGLDEYKAITDKSLLKKSVVMIVLVILGFVFHSQLGMESSTVAMTAAAVMTIIGKQDIEEIISEVEWSTLVFFMALFVVVGGMVESGVIGKLANLLINFTAGHAILTMLVLLWGSALLSSVLDNIPFVATLIPLVMAMGKDGIDVTPLWWAISLGACLGGNGTLIGASANVVLSGISTRHGYPITFKEYLRVGFPFMIVSVVISMIYLLVRYGI